MQVIDALGVAAQKAARSCDLILIDNDLAGQATRLAAQLSPSSRVNFSDLKVIAGQGNIGFGRAHNLALDSARHELHLILNPDAILDASALLHAQAFLDQHPDVVLLSPSVVGQDGQLQYLCRRPPAVFDLLLRGFAPQWIRRHFAKRLARYQMQDLINAENVVFDPPIVSGCFMLFRSAALKRLGGFDARYFLYFEDYDLSLRAAMLGRLAYVPAARIVHLGGHAARKGMRHVVMFASSARTFFGQHGWRWW